MNGLYYNGLFGNASPIVLCYFFCFLYLGVGGWGDWGWGDWGPAGESGRDLIRTHLFVVSEIDDDLADDLWASDVMGLVSAKTASQKIAENAKKDALNHLSSREQNDSIVGMICAKTASKKLMNAKEKNQDRN